MNAGTFKTSIYKSRNTSKFLCVIHKLRVFSFDEKVIERLHYKFATLFLKGSNN